jgi:hypothetical protein
MLRSGAFAGTLPPQGWWVNVDVLVSRLLVQIREPSRNSAREGLSKKVGYSDFLFTLDGKRRYACYLSNRFLEYVRGEKNSSMDLPEVRPKARHIVGVLAENAWIIWGEKLLKIESLYTSLALTILVYMDHVLCGRWDKELKFHLNYYFCKFTKTEFPEDVGSIHKNGTIFFGSLDRYLFRWVSKKTEESWIYLNSILQGVKRGMPQLNVDRINENAVKHAEILGTAKSTPGWLLDEITRTSHEIWNGKVILKQPEISTKVSGNSCLESNRADGGALGYVLDKATNYGRQFWSKEVRKENGLWSSVGLRIPHNWDYLVSMRWHPRVNCKEIRTDLLIDETLRELRHGNPDGLSGRERLRRASDCLPNGPVDELDIQDSCPGEPDFETTGFPREKDVLSRCSNELITEDDLEVFSSKFGEQRSEVKFILEPLKIRTITKSSLFSNALYPEVQKQLWRGLQNFPQFSLTGETMTEGSLDELVWGGHEFFDNVYDLCSGDYSRATDLLHMDASLAAIEGAINDPMTFILVRDNMCGQVIDYKGAYRSKNFVPPEPIVQKNGQLMGSIFSFPFLCAINLAIYRVAMEKHFQRSFYIWELPVKVNGDDILFPTNVDFQKRWEGLIEQVGFSKSVGKNFVSNEFCMVNSMLFKRSEGLVWSLIDGSPVRRYTFVPFINSTALTGIKKGTDTEKDRDVTYNDRLWNLRGAFRDLDIERLPKVIGRRFLERVRTRFDVLDSHFCDYELGISSELPACTGDIRKYFFHQETKKLHGETSSQLNNHILLRSGERVLERFKQPEVRFDISREWSKFNKDQLKNWPTSFEILRKTVGRLLKKNDEERIRRQSV